MLRLVVDNRRLSPVQGINAIAIKDTPEKIAAAAKVISAIDKARAEVVIDVELVEVDRTRLREFGLEIASPGIAAASRRRRRQPQRPDAARSDASLRADVFLTGVPGLFYRLLKNDTHTRVLANPQLRTSEGMTAQARFGERVPVPSVTFAPIASGGVNQQPITSFTYAGRRQHRAHAAPASQRRYDVAFKVEVSSLSGADSTGCRRSAIARSDHHPAARRRDEHAGWPDSRRRAASLEGIPGLATCRSSAGCSRAITKRRNRPTSS